MKEAWTLEVILAINLHTYSMNTYVLLHFEDKNDAIIIVKLMYRAMSCRLKMHQFQHLRVLQSWYNYKTSHATWISRWIYRVSNIVDSAGASARRPTIIWMLTTYPSQLATKYDFSKYDVWRQNRVLNHILNIAQIGTFQYIHSEGYIIISDRPEGGGRGERGV